MKIFAKFKISDAMDKRRPLSDSIQAAIQASSELRAFAKETRAVDKALRRPPYPRADAWLHNSIMRAVRATALEPAPRRVSSGLWLAPAAALVVLAAIGWWLAGPRAPQPAPKMAFVVGQSPFATVSTAFEFGGRMSRQMSAEMIAPLSNEWAQVDADLRGATKAIVDSMP
ncbi:MAG: hypothetical protein ACLQVW_25725 [Limisphaerales bacterium]